MKLNTKLNSKWITDLNVRDQIIKLLGNNKGAKFCELGLSKDFLDTPKAQAKKLKID